MAKNAKHSYITRHTKGGLTETVNYTSHIFFHVVYHTSPQVSKTGYESVIFINIVGVESLKLTDYTFTHKVTHQKLHH